MAKKDYYNILGVNQKASQKDIKSAYRQLALKYHPDHNPGNNQAHKKFAEVKEAYEFLTSKNNRAQYDKTYRPHPEPKAQPQPRKSADKKGQKDLRYNLYISLEDVVDGCERSIRYIRNNKGEKETVQLKVKVPKGAFHQQRLRLAGYGDIIGSLTGDLFVIVHLHNHPMFLRKGHNLRVNVPVSYLDVILGATIEVPTLYGIKKLKLKACDFDSLEINKPGWGLPEHNTKNVGELLIHIFVEHPKSLTRQEQTILQRAQRTWPAGEMMQQYQSYLKQLKDTR